MESTLLGLVLDSSILIAAERAKLRTEEAIHSIRAAIGDPPVVSCALTVAEIGHGIYRSRSLSQTQRRRQFLEELKIQVPIHPMTEARAEIVARIGGRQAARGINIPIGDLIIGASALELGYAVGTSNIRDFERISGLHIIRF